MLHTMHVAPSYREEAETSFIQLICISTQAEERVRRSKLKCAIEKRPFFFEAHTHLHTHDCCSVHCSTALPCRDLRCKALDGKQFRKLNMMSHRIHQIEYFRCCLSHVNGALKFYQARHLACVCVAFVCQHRNDLSCRCRLMNEASCSWADISLRSSSFDVISSMHSLDKLGCPFLTAEALIYAKKTKKVLLLNRTYSSVCLCVCVCMFLRQIYS